MTATRDRIRFLLNNEKIELKDVLPIDTLLDFLRLQKFLRGTKEGCAEGDCGACTVLVGRLVGKELVYETVNACIRFVGSLDGCHVVTVEHLKKPDGTLHPVQQAMISYHGSQCGFCTPGIVMSLYGLWMSNPKPSNHGIETALQGNLCRCTGYEPIIKAAKNISEFGELENDPLVVERQSVIDHLIELRDGKTVDIEFEGKRLIIPATLDALAEARSEYPGSTIVAGSTDVGLWVTKHMREISPAIFIGNLDENRNIVISEGGVTIGSGVSYTDFWETLKKHFPQLTEYWSRIGGEQVRNMGTIGGNIANGSPIGDTPPPLIVLGAKVTLRKGTERRVVPLEDFFIDYGKQDREEGDFVESVYIPFPSEGEHFAAYKISKRIDEDISAVAFSCLLKTDDGKVTNARIACGGMAGVPKRAKATEDYLLGKHWNEETLNSAVEKMQEDFTPLSDWRASAAYRSQVAANLLRRFYMDTSRRSEGLRLDRTPAE